MDNQIIFALQFLMSLTVYAFIAQWFVKPWLSKKSQHEALMLLILPNAFRHIGLVFLATGVVAHPVLCTFPRRSHGCIQQPWCSMVSPYIYRAGTLGNTFHDICPAAQAVGLFSAKS